MDTVTGNKLKHIAVWAITPNGAQLALKIKRELQVSQIFISESANFSGSEGGTKNLPDKIHIFSGLKAELEARFRMFDAHVFIFATGIAVRMIAPLLESKTRDPAVVVIDDKGFHAISLVSGHLGGANALTACLAEKLNALPVITTATDVNCLPAIDMIAAQLDLEIENPEAIKHVNMKILKGRPLKIHDPDQQVLPSLPEALVHPGWTDSAGADLACTWRTEKVSRETLVLRPKLLSLGIGCNRGTSFEDIQSFLGVTAKAAGFSLASLANVGTTVVKADEPGILSLGKALNRPVYFYTKDELNSVESIENPSKMVEKHLGVKSVCEAAAILASENGRLILPKQKTGDITLAVGKRP